MKHRILAWIMAAVLTVGLLPATAWAADTFSVATSSGQIEPTENAEDYTKEYLITGDVTVTGSTKNGRLIVTENGITITLQNVSMALDWCKGSPIEIVEDVSATLILDGENTLSAFADGPGILVNQGATVTIQSKSGKDSLIVSGAKAGNYVGADMGIDGGNSIFTDGYAGIGGPNFDNATDYTGTINIESGTITATGYSYGAGIGGGDYSSGGKINISGGIVTAISGGTSPDGWASVPDSEKKGAGIGGSQGCGSGDINISGGTVTAYGGYGCPGIGGAPCDVTISGSADVTAYGGDLAAGIGGYDKDKGRANQVTISDAAAITAYGGKGAAGLGEGSGGSAAQFTLKIDSGTEVTAYSDGAKAAVTGTPTDGSAPIVNMRFDPDLTIPSQVGAIPLTLTGTEASNTKTLTVPEGYRAAAATMPEGVYTATASIGGQTTPLLGLNGVDITSNTSYTPVVVSIPQVPSAPQNLKAVSGDGEVTLSWSAPEKAGTGPVTKYKVYWSTTKPTGENPTSENILETEANVTTTTVTGLTNGTTYYFWVVAENKDGAGNASEAAAAIPLAPGGAVQVDSADGLEAALENDAVTDIEVVGDITYDESILAEKNITVKSGVTLTLKYSSGFYTPYSATACNANIQVEQGGTITFVDTCWWSSMFTSPSIHSYLLMNGDFALEAGASAYTKIENSGDNQVTKPGYILFRGNFTNSGSFVNHATTGTEVYLNYGTTPGTFTDEQSTSFSPKYNLCISEPISVGPPEDDSDLAGLAIPLTGIEGGAYVGGQLEAVVDGFGTVQQGGPFSIIWNSTGPATDAPYTVQEADKGQTVTAQLDGALDVQEYGYFLVSDTANGPVAYQISKFSTDPVSRQIAAFAVILNVNGGDPLEESTLVPSAEGKLSSLPTPTRSGYTFNGWFTAASGGEQVTVDTVFSQDSMIYAQWTAVSTGGSGGSSATRYPVTVEDTGNGSIRVSPTRAERGDTVTITVNPDDGYELDKLTVTDSDGDEISVRDRGHGKYTFTMPRSRVTVEATFIEIVEEPEALPFVDVPTGAYYYDAVAWAVENNITSGTSATTFGPNAACTRAQMVTFLWRAAGSPEPETTVNPFTDVSASAYYYEAVLWAAEQGITSGTSATTFSPDTTVTRGQTATFLWRYAGSPAASGSSFTDVAADAYYANAVAWALNEGITNGTTATTFSPSSSCTRAQIVTFLYRYMG